MNGNPFNERAQAEAAKAEAAKAQAADQPTEMRPPVPPEASPNAGDTAEIWKAPLRPEERVSPPAPSFSEPVVTPLEPTVPLGGGPSLTEYALARDEEEHSSSRGATLIATIALLAALLALALVLGLIPHSTVGTAQLKPSAVTSPKIADGTISANDISRDVTKGLAGPAGPEGKQGPRGPAGPTGTFGRAVIAVGQSSSGSATTRTAEAKCPKGQLAIAGGARVEGKNTNVAIQDSEPTESQNAWKAGAVETAPSKAGWNLVAYAVCVKGPSSSGSNTATTAPSKPGTKTTANKP
jgi:hypothetical protein